jgi:hypothetical protein
LVGVEDSVRYWKGEEGEEHIYSLQTSVESVPSLEAAPTKKKVVLSLEVALVKKAVGQVALSLEAAL